MIVKAEDDDEYITIQDPEIYSAYKFWSLYGLTPDTSYTYEKEYSTTGTINLALTLSISGNGGFSYDEHSDGYFDGVVNWLVDQHYFHLGAMTLEGETTNYTGSGSCTYKFNATGTGSASGNGSVSCVIEPNDTYSPIELTIAPKEDGLLGWSLSDPYQIMTSFSGTDSDAESPLFIRNNAHASGALHGDASGNLSGTGTLSFTTRTTNTNNLSFVYPNVSGVIDNTYKSRKSITIPSNDIVNIAILTPSKRYNSLNTIKNSLHVYNDNHNTEITEQMNISAFEKYFGGYNLIYYEIQYNSSTMVVLDFDSIQVLDTFIPLYVGTKKNMSDNLYRFIYGSDRNIEAINEQGNKVDTSINQQAEAIQEQAEQQHNEMMDTSDSSQLAGTGQNLIDTTNEKFGDLFFPITHMVDTANRIANVQLTQKVMLPCIFDQDKYYEIDFGALASGCPEAYSFIRVLLQCAVSMYLLHGLYHIVFGGSNDDS